MMAQSTLSKVSIWTSKTGRIRELYRARSGCGRDDIPTGHGSLEQPTGGQITVNGLACAGAGRREAYVATFSGGWAVLRLANIRLPLEVWELPKSEQAERVAACLNWLRLSGLNKFPWQLWRDAAAGEHCACTRSIRRYFVDGRAVLVRSTRLCDHLNEQLLKLWARTGKTIAFVTIRSPKRCI
jgi:NitT/TauT family transport system ATP-binding protein